ncbi:MAG TPA: Na+/H+ antiporter [Pyrinomonadaceae bacterium]|nr:Na+/H+ antiporter [Pyrinomonadaceae bacterium]
MHDVFIEYVYLILIILGFVMIADKLRLPYPIVLVVGGLLLSFTSRFSDITIDPDLVFFIFLPPLLYEAAWQVSWKELWRWRRLVTSFAFPLVIVTATVVAFVSSALIPGFSLALGFLLGGIISPPDAVSATTIMRRVDVSKSLVSITEGESLLNDASSLIVFRFALAATVTGQFHFQEAALSFLVVIFMGTLIGLVVGMVFYAIHRWLPTTTGIEIVMTLVTPYCMYYAAEHFHFSGVLAVVSGGLFQSARRQTMLGFRTRLEAVNVWDSLVFVLNGLVFLLIGLQLPSIVGQLGETSLTSAIFYGLVISLTLIVARMAITLAASPFTRFMSRFITVEDAHPGWRNPIILGWAGMRGVVSLAMALSIPIFIDRQPFPYRNLVLFITFVVILVTLVFQGLTLPWVIRKVGADDKYSTIPAHQQELIIQKKIAKTSLEFLNEKYGEHRVKIEHLDNLVSRLEIDLQFLEKQMDGSGDGPQTFKSYHSIYLKLLEHQRQLLEAMNHSAELDEDLIRKYLSLIDLEEYKLREKRIEEAPQES